MWVGEVMPLTPEDVSNKRFTPVRLREGYDHSYYFISKFMPVMLSGMRRDREGDRR